MDKLRLIAYRRYIPNGQLQEIAYSHRYRSQFPVSCADQHVFTEERKNRRRRNVDSPTLLSMRAFSPNPYRRAQVALC